jgi:hypothetical protein
MARKISHNEYLKTIEGTIWNPIEEYINARTKILHKCTEGHEVMLLPRYAQNNGCQKCKSESERLSDEYYRNKLKETKWTAIEKYVTAKTKILHICKNGHKNMIKPHHAQKDVGCMSCNIEKNKEGINTIPGILYYVKFEINNKFYYKIGITRQKTVKQRFLGDIQLINKIILEKHFASFSDARLEEQKILKKFSNYRQNLNLLYSKGNTEIFEFDILGLDTEK